MIYRIKIESKSTWHRKTLLIQEFSYLKETNNLNLLYIQHFITHLSFKKNMYLYLAGVWIYSIFIIKIEIWKDANFIF